MADTRPTINARDLIAVLKSLPASKSVLIIGPHGIGKSMITAAISKHFVTKHIDKRLAQMTEGDMIGLPIVADDVTRFLAVDWFIAACKEPCTVLLDELNRATMEIMNGAFQIILDRELNGNHLHPESRVFACVNAGSSYSVNEMDPALINRFAIFHFEPDIDDWKTWARMSRADGGGEIDPVIVDYIHHHPTELRFKDVEKMEALTAYPTPRGWEAVDVCLKHAGISASEVCGKNTPDIFFHMVASIVGHPAAIGFTKFVKDYSRIVTAADVLDRWQATKERVKSISHDAVVGVIDKIGEHCKTNKWTEAQMKNLVQFSNECLTGEDHILLFSKITSSKALENVKLYHGSGLMIVVMEACNSAEKINSKKT